jgi:phosphopantothenoylcysteine decarboxylase/phosphopantothenate--cysteine ligase
MLSDKKILLAVCGSIAAYKTAFFIRLLKKQGAEVKVLMTKSATDFITPLTLSTLSKNPVSIDFFDKADGDWTNHVELGLWADLYIVAPASANTIAKMANGICDNLLLATYLSARCPVMIAPAMDLDMYQHPATQQNLQTLSDRGNQIIDSDEGELASGLEGKGRMAEPESILGIIETHFKKKALLDGKRVLITSGPTYESIDPVRFIGNHSTGKMGNALAKASVQLGAKVDLVSGPVSQYPNIKDINLHRVKTATEMLNAVQALYREADIVIFAAAVSDYRPAEQFEEKKKRDGQDLSLHLVENPDIAATLGSTKKAHAIHIGFALETNDGLRYAKDKLARKNFDFVVLNQMIDQGAGFGHDTNKVTVIGKDNIVFESELKSKEEIAFDILKNVLA